MMNTRLRATPDPSLADGELMDRWRTDSDAGALEQLIRRHGGMVLGVCRRILRNPADVDDAFQAVFLVLVRRARSLTRPGQVAGWLHGVALRVARKARAARARRRGFEGALIDTPAPPPPEDNRELRRIIDEELDRLPENYRLPIVLCELEERTLEETARLLGWPKGTVAGRLSRGRDALRQRLSRRRGLALPLFLPGLAGTVRASAPDSLVSATMASAAGPAGPAPGPAALANEFLRDAGRRIGRLLALLLVAGGLIAGLTWEVRAATTHHGGPAESAGSGCHVNP